MLSTDPTSFRAQYQALISSGAIEADPAQADAAEAFAALEERLSSYKPARKLSLLGRLGLLGLSRCLGRGGKRRAGSGDEKD